MFGSICLKIVKDINESTFERNELNCYLSVKDEVLLGSCCQLIACFCIHYSLEDNVGVSIDKLSKYGVNIIKNRESVDIKTRNSRLVTCLNELYQLKQNKRVHVDIINGIFYRKYMHELLCALLQTCYSPNSQLVDKNDYLKWLEVDLFEEANGALLVSNLIMAQGSNRTKSTLWCLNIIGKLLKKERIFVTVKR